MDRSGSASVQPDRFKEEINASTNETAQATVFYTETTGSGSACTLAAPCATIGDSVAAARLDVAGPHTIHVGPGIYAEAIELDNAADAGLTIEGAGSGDDPLYDTIVAFQAGPANSIGAHLGDASHTLRGLRIEVTPFLLEETGDMRGVGLYAAGPDVALEDLYVGVGDTDGDYGIELRGGGASVDGVTVRVGTAAVLYSDGLDDPGVPALTVRDSDLVGEAGSAALETRAGADLLLQRSIVQAAPEAEASVRVEGAVTSDSSVIAGGVTALQSYDQATLRGVTLDRACRGSSTPRPSQARDPWARRSRRRTAVF